MLLAKRRPTLGGELTAQARRNVAADERGFDRNGARTAKWIGENSSGAPIAELHERCGECLTELSFTDKPTVATFVEANACRVERQCGDVLANAHFDRASRPSFWQLIHAMSFSQTLNDRA